MKFFFKAMDHKKESSIGLYFDPERFFLCIFKIIPEKPEKVSEVTPYDGAYRTRMCFALQLALVGVQVWRYVPM